MPDVSVRSVSNGPTGNGVDTTFTAPSGIQNGDILLAIFRVGQTPFAPSIIPPLDFNSLNGYPILMEKVGDTFKTVLHAYVKIASGESGDYTFSHSTAFRAGMMYCIMNSDTSNPINPNPTIGTGVDAVVTAPSIVPVRDGSLVIYVCHTWDVAGPATPPAGSTPTFNERYNPPQVIYLADGALTPAGATGDKSITSQNGVGSPWIGSLISVAAQAAAAAVESQFFESTDAGYFG